MGGIRLKKHLVLIIIYIKFENYKFMKNRIGYAGSRVLEKRREVLVLNTVAQIELTEQVRAEQTPGGESRPSRGRGGEQKRSEGQGRGLSEDRQ